MGTQCNIILSYYTEKYNEKSEISKLLNLQANADSSISPIGDRAFGCGLKVEVICMKNWGKQECLLFLEQLKTNINWNYKETVQVYYAPAIEGEKNYEQFKFVKLF